MALVVADRAWDPVLLGQSRARVFRLVGDGGPDLFLKVAVGYRSRWIDDEAARLRWARTRAPVPRVVVAESAAAASWLVTEALPGEPASDPRWTARPRRVVEALAGALRRLHALPVHDCPFDRSVASTLADAVERARAGVVDEEDFADDVRGRGAADLLAELEATRPREDDLVVAHGDPCLPNLLLADGGGFGLVDVGGLGVSDFHRDLALAAESVSSNLGDAWVDPFLDAYGARPDPVRMRWWRLVNELF